MRISPIILFSVDFVIYAIFDEDLSQDLSTRFRNEDLPLWIIENLRVKILFSDWFKF